MSKRRWRKIDPPIPSPRETIMLPFDISDAIEKAAATVASLHDKTLMRSTLWLFVYRTQNAWDDKVYAAIVNIAGYLKQHPEHIKVLADKIEATVTGGMGNSVGSPAWPLGMWEKIGDDITLVVEVSTPE